MKGRSAIADIRAHSITNWEKKSIRTRVITALIALFVTAGLASTALGQTKKEIEAALIGYWISNEAAVEFKPKGVIVISGERYQWSILGKSLILTSSEGSLDLPFQLKGDTLSVWSDGRKVVYQRADKDEYEDALTMPNRDGRDSGGANSGGGSNPQDLVGKWCYQANVQAQGGGRQSDICFTLKADGSYEYYGEASNSNVYGGSNSQNWDYGRWSATATSLTARSNSGKTTTYTLERRNHPKTGDPMLMVDGDAFVTYYQKRPW